MQFRKRGQEPIAKWPEGCSALLVPDPFSDPDPRMLTDFIFHQNIVFSLPRSVGPNPAENESAEEGVSGLESDVEPCLSQSQR